METYFHQALLILHLYSMPKSFECLGVIRGRDSYLESLVFRKHIVAEEINLSLTDQIHGQVSLNTL